MTCSLHIQFKRICNVHVRVCLSHHTVVTWVYTAVIYARSSM